MYLELSCIIVPSIFDNDSITTFGEWTSEMEDSIYRSAAIVELLVICIVYDYGEGCRYICVNGKSSI